MLNKTRNKQHKRLFTDWFYRPKREPNHKKEKSYKKPTKRDIENELDSKDSGETV